MPISDARENTFSGDVRPLTTFDPLRGPTPLGEPIPRIIPRPETDFWVFAYGSLIWNPGFDVEETRAVRVHGYHRRFCVRSTFYRGTDSQPGLVVGLRPGGQVTGVIHRVSAAKADPVLSYLEDREFRHDGYRHVYAQAQTTGGELLPALTFMVPDNSHSLLLLSEKQVAETIATARGNNGPNTEYLFNMNAGLREAGINPGKLNGLERQVRSLL